MGIFPRSASRCGRGPDDQADHGRWRTRTYVPSLREFYRNLWRFLSALLPQVPLEGRRIPDTEWITHIGSNLPWQGSVRSSSTLTLRHLRWTRMRRISPALPAESGTCGISGAYWTRLTAQFPVGVPEVRMPCDLRRRPRAAVRHHDHPCPCAWSTSSSPGSAAGWSYPAGHRPATTPSCSCCHEIAMLRRTHPRPRLDWADRAGPRRAHPAPARKSADAPASRPPAPSCGGTAA